VDKVESIEREKQVLEHDSDMEGKVLTFFIENQLMAIPISDVVQIVGKQEISEIPDSANYMKGVINLRGSIIPVVDIRLRLGKVEKEHNERTCIIVVLIDYKEVGFIVDEVDAVVVIAPEDVSSPPQLGDNKNKTYLLGIAKLDSKVVLIIDASKVLSSEFMMDIENYI